MAVKFEKIKGLPELLKKLNDLGSTETINKIAHRATFAAMKDMKKDAHDIAQSLLMPPEDSGALLKAFVHKRVQIGTRRGYAIFLRAGRNRVKRKGASDAFYWTWLNFGKRGFAGLHFMEKAFNKGREKAAATILSLGRKNVIDSGNLALRKFGNGAK